MDGTREDNLKRLYRDFNNPLLPVSTRKKAYGVFCEVLRQANDRTLSNMRRRLLRARGVDDAEAAERVTMQIHDYMKRAGYTAAG